MELSSYQGFRFSFWLSSQSLLRALSKIAPAEGALVLASLGVLRVLGSQRTPSFSSSYEHHIALRTSPPVL